MQSHGRAGAATQDGGGAGAAFLSEAVWASIHDALRLSGREAEIVRCILDGCSKGAIARRLGISCHTVHTHLERLYRKLGVRSRGEVVVRLFATYVEMNRPSAGPG